MPNNNFINLLTKLSEALISGGKKDEKAGYKPVNDQKTNESSGGKPSTNGDFSSKSQQTVSPKQSVIEMLRRHDEISRKIDTDNTK